MSRLQEAIILVKKEIQLSHFNPKQEVYSASDSEDNEVDQKSITCPPIPHFVQQLLTLQQQQTEEIRLLKSSLWTEHKTQELLMENARYLSQKRDTPTARVTNIASKRSNVSTDPKQSRVAFKPFDMKPKGKISHKQMPSNAKKPDFDVSVGADPILKSRSGLTSSNKKSMDIKNAENLAISDLKLQKKAKELELERLIKLNKELTIKRPKRIHPSRKIEKSKPAELSAKRKNDLNQLLRVNLQKHTDKVDESHGQIHSQSQKSINAIVQEEREGIDISIQCDLNAPISIQVAEIEAPILISAPDEMAISNVLSDDFDQETSVLDSLVGTLQEEVFTIMHTEKQNILSEQHQISTKSLVYIDEATAFRIIESKDNFFDYMQVFLGFLNLNDPWEVLAQ